ncbi:hypothetical protein MTR_3g078140 [Medicago truncatula]|uniref:Uncharacterized protein n=1 Tax=Medicago truncatula TaxID=3880 RepID=A0A072V011_MEDTR|nr:hypothetical protein MTR_3g078140 [Medicago truncatula]
MEVDVEPPFDLCLLDLSRTTIGTDLSDYQCIGCVLGWLSIFWGEGMVLQSKAGKTFGLKEHLQRYLHLPPCKGISGARTRVLSDSRPVFLPLDQAFEVHTMKYDMYN